MGNNIQIFGRTFSDVSSITVNNTSSSAVKYVQEPILGDITIKPENCVSSNTQITPETYVFEDNNLPGQSFTIDNFGIIADFKQTDGIKLESGKTYHCIAHVFVKWDDDNSEEYCYADSNFVNSGINITLDNFNWEGSSGATQTITSITLQLDSSNRYRVRLRINRNTSTSKSGVLLPGSFYRITQVNTNGYDTINLDFNSDPRFLNIYQSLAYRSMITSSAPYVSEWCNSLSSFTTQQFAGQPFSGDFTFNNIKTINYYAFGSVYAGTEAGAYNYFGLNFPSCSAIWAAAFVANLYLQSVSFPECTAIGSSAFQNCRRLAAISFPECTTIGISAFQSCYSLTTISFPECTTIGDNAFYTCISLTTISFPKCTTIGNYAFSNCSKLTIISFPECTTINFNAFQSCTRLTSAYFPECTSIGGNAFYSCYSLTTISFPKCTYIDYQAFYYCSSLTSAYFPECSILSNNAFRNCSNLAIVSFPKCTTIANYVFNNCSKLESAYFMASSIISLGGTNVFTFTPMSLSSYLGYYGSIYVPASLLASYKTATNWTIFSSRMVGI